MKMLQCIMESETFKGETIRYEARERVVYQ